MAELERRFYVPEHLHTSMRFDIYTNGLVVMYVYGIEVTRKKLRRTLNADIFATFAEELAAYGIGIAPRGELAEFRERLEKVEEKLKRLKRRR